MPGFQGEHMVVTLAEPLPGCQFSRGYVFMSHVSSSSAESYNYIFTHATAKLRLVYKATLRKY